MIFNPFAKTWEFSFGARYLNYDQVTETGVLTASVSHYYAKFLSIARLNAGFGNLTSNITDFSGSFIQRYYHSDTRYSSIFASYGYDPNLQLFENNTNVLVSENSVFNFGINSLFNITSTWDALFQFEYSYFNFGVSTRNQYSISIKIFYKL